eukprot:360461-Chlamydomonas_euryale.AAC.4
MAQTESLLFGMWAPLRRAMGVSWCSALTPLDRLLSGTSPRDVHVGEHAAVPQWAREVMEARPSAAEAAQAL